MRPEGGLLRPLRGISSNPEARIRIANAKRWQQMQLRYELSADEEDLRATVTFVESTKRREKKEEDEEPRKVDEGLQRDDRFTSIQ